VSKDVRRRKGGSRKTAPKQTGKPKKISRLRKPEGMALEDWQVALRKQYAGEQSYRLKNVGGEPIFSEFEVTNPETRRTYRVAIRGEGLGVNYCSCPDYAVNTLGTCKHIEFTLGKLHCKRGAKTAFARGFHPTYSEVYLRYGPKRDVLFQAGVECSDSLRKLARRYFDVDGVLKPDSLSRFHTFLEEASSDSEGHELRCYDDALEFVSQARDRAELISRIDKAYPNGPSDESLGKIVTVPLYPYQCAGALFAARAGRCLIADDMGLGKTVQAIAATELLARHAGIERVLVICPTSLKHQWKREIESFSKRSARVVEGRITDRRSLYAADHFYKIVNYDVIHRDLENIEQGRFDLIILDEAQRIKNWKTRAAQAVKKLDSDYAFVLTGTPLENRLEELHSIVEFVDRHRLGPMFRFLHTHQHVDENGRVVGYRNLDAISKSLGPILIRRTKESVLKELPQRLEKKFFVPMTEQQKTLHDENHEIVGRIAQKWRRYGYLSEIDQRRLTCALQNMRMSCNSTYLLDKQTDHGHKADELLAWLEEVFEDRDAKAVVFSQWLGTHELIARRLARRKLDHVLFHGGVPGTGRKKLIQRFREDPECRLFLSTDAGGVGLNLQHAGVVANMDLPWNPAVLEQRIGRVHRLGQHRPVRVVNFIAKGTIEEGMLGLLKFKKSMFAGVLDGGKKDVFLGGTRLKKFMDSVERATGPLGDGSARGDQQAHRPDSTSAPAASAETTPRQPGANGPADRPKTPDALQPEAIGQLLSAGAALLDELGRSLRQTDDASSSESSSKKAHWIDRDPATGQSYLKLPLPQGQAGHSLLDLLGGIAANLQQRR
jgi:superfamily II DNA or RNA helicase